MSRRKTPEGLLACLLTIGTAIGCQAAEPKINPVQTTDLTTPVATVASTETPADTPTPLPTAESTPTATLSPTPTVTATSQPSSFLEVLTSPFTESAAIEDNSPARQYPQRQLCIDPETNKDRLNVLIALKFEDFQPPVTTRPGNFGMGFMLASLNTKSGEITLLSFSDDFHVPKVAIRGYRQPKLINPATRLNQTLKFGGIDLLREQFECATSLKVNDTLIIDEKELATGIDFLGGIDYQSNIDTVTMQYFWQGELQKPLILPKGKPVHLTGKEAIGAFKSVPYEQEGYTTDREHHVRASIVANGILQAALRQLIEKRERFAPEIASYLNKRTVTTDGSLSADFPLPRLNESLTNIQKDPVRLLLNPQTYTNFPRITRRVNVADDNSGSFSGVSHGCNGIRSSSGDMFLPKETASDQENPYLYWLSLNQCFRSILK